MFESLFIILIGLVIDRWDQLIIYQINWDYYDGKKEDLGYKNNKQKGVWDVLKD